MKISKTLYKKSISALNKNELSNVKNIQKIIDKTCNDQKKLKIGIVRSFTLETQTDFIKLALSILPSKVELKLSNLNNIEQEVLNPKSTILSWEPDIVLILWRIEELIPNIKEEFININERKIKSFLKELKKRINTIIKNYFKISNTPIVISTLPNSHLSYDHNYKEHSSIHEFINHINDFILREARNNKNLHIFEFNKWSNNIGNLFHDEKMDYYAKQAISLNFIGNFSLFLARSLRPLILSSAKAIAIDLDNVLWGGVLGEDGVNNLHIDYNFPGNIYRSIQLKIKSLKKKGFLIFLLSKNNLNDVKVAFKKLNDMPLKLNDFDALKVNWKEKHENIKDLSKTFNIGLESFVFIDDQKFEQKQMNYYNKEVITLLVDDDPINILNEIDNCVYLDKSNTNNEDLLRNDDYKANIERSKLKNKINDSSSFLKSLELKAKIKKINKDNINRAFDLIHKTNQFNLRTNRISLKRLKDIADNKSNVSLVISLSDKFGNQGIIGLIIGILNQQKNSIFIDNFLLSCRAIGRGVEDILFYDFLQKVKKIKILKIESEYISTSKNNQVANLYAKFGFKNKLKNKKKSLYFLDLPTKYNKPDWIKLLK